MSENASDLRKALVELIETEPEPAEHPSADRWIAYQRGELPAEEEARLAEHLVRCRDCFDLVQAAEALVGPEPDSDAALASAAVWRLLRPRLAHGDSAEPGEVERPAGRSRKPGFRFRFSYALAAALFAAVVGLTAWNLEQQSALTALRAPRPNPITVAYSSGDRRVESGEKTVTEGTGPWRLVFNPSDELHVYWLTIRDGGTGREVFSPLLLRTDENLALTLHLPEGLAPGHYRLELADGSRKSPGDSLETHFLRVVPRGG
jgi:hypothetical protein